MATPVNETPLRRQPEPDLAPNRKLIRPSLAELRGQMVRVAPSAAPVPSRPAPSVSAVAAAPAPSPAHSRPPAPAPARVAKKPVPPDQTNAENFYYLKQMQSKTEMVLVLRDGERVRGVIEWYDRHCVKVHRQGEPNLLIYKAIIKYIYKAEEESA